MRFKGSLAMSLIVLLFLVGGVTGCGGSDQQDTGGEASGGQSQQSASGGSNNGAGQEGEDAPETKIAIGRVAKVDPENRRFVLKPTRGETIIFKVIPEAQIRLDDREAELADMKRGQQVQVEYVIRELGVPNRARSIMLFSDGADGGGAN